MLIVTPGSEGGTNSQSSADEHKDDDRARSTGWRAVVCLYNSLYAVSKVLEHMTVCTTVSWPCFRTRAACAENNGRFCRQNNNWGNRRRKFAVLVATMPLGPERVVGCIVLSIAAPQALLPAPWPSRASLQCCVSNLAVAPLQRRQGIASKLLGSSEKLGKVQDAHLTSELHS